MGTLVVNPFAGLQKTMRHALWPSIPTGRLSAPISATCSILPIGLALTSIDGKMTHTVWSSEYDVHGNNQTFEATRVGATGNVDSLR